MRVAFVHDWLVVSGGAEKVTREILRTFDADVFALVDFLNEADREFILHGKHATTSFIQQLPSARDHFRNYLPLFPSAMERLDLSSYDLVLSASYAVAKGVRTTPYQVHVCYIHTPMRYAWVNEEGYLADHDAATGPKGWFIRMVLDRLRKWDLRTNASVDRFIANSTNVAERVERIYDRDAEVLLPPVDMDRFTLGTTERKHFIAANRLVPYKRVDRIIEAFRQLPNEALLVCGDGPERKKWQTGAPQNVHFLGHVPQQEFVALLGSAKALVAAADEDLGLTPMEAQACGTPVIALGKGGYRETVVEGVSGILFDTDRPEDIASGIRRFLHEGIERSPCELRQGMMAYSSDRFRERYKALVESAIRAKHG
jgi:glycosyltransferase involved in cell wall biosynthesis